MKAAVLHQFGGPFVIEEVNLQDPGPGEVMVRLAASGVCHSDWHMVTGDLRRPFPVVLGHEGAGTIEALGEGVTRLQVGQRVVLSWAPGCGGCFYCRRAKSNLCETFMPIRRSGTMLDGSTRLDLNGEKVYQFSTHSTFAECAVTPQEACIPVDEAIPLQVAALVGCAVMTGVGAATNTVQVRPGDSVAVYGCGGVGLNILQGAALCGAGPIIAIDQVPAKLESALTFGATHTVAAGPQAVEAVQELTQGRGADYVFEAIGTPAVQEEALEAVRPGGTLVLVGVAPRESLSRFSGFALHVHEKTIAGCLYGTPDPHRDFPILFDHYKAGRLKLDELISRQYRLDQINLAYEHMLAGQINRGVIVFD